MHYERSKNGEENIVLNKISTPATLRHYNYSPKDDTLYICMLNCDYSHPSFVAHIALLTNRMVMAR